LLAVVVWIRFLSTAAQAARPGVPGEAVLAVLAARQ